jgi:hypothetical protein
MNCHVVAAVYNENEAIKYSQQYIQFLAIQLFLPLLSTSDGEKEQTCLQ